MYADLLTAIACLALASAGIGAVLEYTYHAWHLDHRHRKP